jgi:hypothetical protein
LLVLDASGDLLLSPGDGPCRPAYDIPRSVDRGDRNGAEKRL